MPDDLRAEFKAMAQDLIESFSRDLNVTLGYDQRSVEYFDAYISRNRAAIMEKTGGQYSGLVNAIASFLGECIIANYGGEWKRSEKGAWGIYFANGSAAFPFSKVQKAFSAEDDFESLASFYRIAGLFKEGKIGKSNS